MKSSRTFSTEMEESFVGSEQRRVLNGCLDNLPSVSSKVIRIFTSSTFTDTQLERNALMKHVYPKLKDYCRREYGIEFQVVDMRWGVTDEALDDHMTIEVCLNEIKNCQNVSTGPNFMVLLGMKYGYRPLPRLIEVGELEKMMTIISEDAEDLSLVNTWYMKDTNAIPPVYVLLPVSTHLVYFNKKNLHTLYERDRNTWWNTLEQLLTILRRAAVALHAENQISSKQLHNYFMSMTEREVNCGVLSLENPSKHCLVYMREIEGLEQAESDFVKNFIDMSSDGRQIDAESQVLHLNLKRKLSKLKPKKLPKNSLQEYKLQWTGEKGIDIEGNVEHEKYLDQFIEHFESSMMRLINESMGSNQKKLVAHAAFESMYNEALQHLHACRNQCKMFHGQEATLKVVSSYLQSASNLPLVIHGKSGCGKTSIVAKAYNQVLQRSSSGASGPVMIIRFLGTSPNSSLVISLIRNISQQIAVCYGHEAGKDSPTEMSLLIQHFNKMLTLASAERPLLLFLDSIDQLSTAYEARLLQWIPDRLPPHVKLVLTTLPVCEGDDLLGVLRKKFSSSANFAEVGTLGEREGSVILESWLLEAGRTVTTEQRDEIDRALLLCSLPLFLRLVFDQICRWRSFDLRLAVVAELSTTIHDSINALFSRLEVDYGQTFVSSTFAYITLAKDGLSETELDDLLSLDDDVLNSVYQYHEPPVRRIPPLLWTRLRTQIPNYLTEREADGLNVISWYHRQFAEVARKRYLSNVNTTKKFHSLLADYFLGTWSGRPKPFRYTEEQRKMFGLEYNEMDSSADRLVAEQPLAFLCNGKFSSYNLRKLSQLPHHLVSAERVEDIETNVLLSFSWLHAKLTAMPLQTVLADFAELLAVRPDPEIRVILDSLRLAGCSLTRYPDVLGTQVVGRLLPYYHTHSKIKRLIDQCQTVGIKANALVPVNHCKHTPGGPLLYSLVRHSGVPFGIVVTSDKRYLISVSRICIVWDISVGDVWRTIEPPIRGFMQGLALSADDAHAVCYTNPGNQIVVIHPLTGHFYIVDNPLAASSSSNLLGLRCDDGHVLVWSLSYWAVIDMSGKTCAVGDFLHANYNIVDMFMTPRATKPIVNMACANPMSHVIRAVGLDFEDFIFTGPVALTKDLRSGFACSSDASQCDKEAGLTGRGSVIALYSVNERVWSKQHVVGESAHAVYSLTLSDDESWLVASVKPGFLLWQTAGNGGQDERTILSLSKGKTNYPCIKNSCVFSRHNEYLMASCGKTIFVYSVRRRHLLKEISAHFDRIKDIVAVSTDRLNIAISSSSDRTIKIWNFDNITKPVPEPTQHDKEIDSIAVSGRCERAVCVMRESLGVWNTANGSLERTLEVSAFKATSAPVGVMIRVNCAVISNSGEFVIGADTQKMMIWETDGGRILHVHYFSLESDLRRLKEPAQLLLTDDDSRVLVILRTKVDLQQPDLPLKGLCVCVKIATRELAYEADFLGKNNSMAVLTSNNLYLVIPIHVDKAGFARLGVWHVNIGIFLYEINIDNLKASPIVDLVAQRHTPSRVAVVDRSKASLVEINRKLWKNSADCHAGSFVRWNGRCTSDGRFGVRKSLDGMSLQMFDLNTDQPVRTLYTGQHPGDINGSVFLTKNDKHAVYYQAHNNMVRVFRFGQELVRDADLAPAVGVLYPEGRVCGLEDTADGMKLVIGLSDGRMVVYVIADPALQASVDKLAECRRFVEQNTKASMLNGEHGLRKNSRWRNVLNIARITSKATIATRSNSAICSLQ